VPAKFDWWVWSFIFYWSFALEIVIVYWALMIRFEWLDRTTRRFGIYLALAMLVVYVSAFLSLVNYSVRTTESPVDALVVLGASQWNGKPSPVFQDRLDHAYLLYNLNVSDTIIVTGGNLDDTVSEAEVGRDYLIQRGIRNEDIRIEDRGRRTIESARYVREKYGSEIKTISVVTQGFHTKRTVMMFENQGFTAYPSPSSNDFDRKGIKYYLRETIALIFYTLFDVSRVY
jgi:uncharacterized SAM-binding protein YcdF (DUF218 family)